MTNTFVMLALTKALTNSGFVCTTEGVSIRQQMNRVEEALFVD